MENLAVLLVALAIDVILGDPPNPIHPVFWLGKAISLQLRLAPRHSPRAQLAYGAAIVILTLGLLGAGAYFLLDYLREVSTPGYVVLAAFLLKSTFSIRGLDRAALKVKRALEEGDLDQARQELGSLVSRDTKGLDQSCIVSATVESASENTSDSFVAPLLCFLLLGVPGAVAYRVVNTFDAMIGYHGQYEYLGKFAARLDDVLNFIPSRISALLIVLAAYVSRKDGRRAWQTMLRDAAKTESPNAGWPMSAAAGALRTRLEKAGHYQLGDPNNPLTPGMIVSAVRLVNVVAIMWVGLCLVSSAV
jgi:adenosylcobinamide-phosphate synthase